MPHPVSLISRVIVARKRGDAYEVISKREGVSVRFVYNTCKGVNFAGACALHVWREGLTPPKLEALAAAEMERREQARYA